MAAQLSQLDGGISYVEAAYVKTPLQAAALTNAGGQSLRPDNASSSQALAAIDLGPELTGSNPNPAVGYPIVTFSWILLYKSGNGAQLDPLRQAFSHTLSPEAQAMAPQLGYVSLPAPVLDRARKRLDSLKP